MRDRTEIFVNVRDAAAQIIQGKGRPTTPSACPRRILESVLNDENRILPVSSCWTNYRPLGRPDGDGIDDVCLSVPSIVNRKGVEQPLEIPMNDAEVAGLRNAARADPRGDPVARFLDGVRNVAALRPPRPAASPRS